MFQNKTILLSGDNKEFNKLFIKRFYNEVKEFVILTSDIFDNTYDDKQKVKLISGIELEKNSFKNIDYIYHFIEEEIKDYKNYFSIKNEYDILASNIIKTSISSKVQKVIFLSDGTTSIANEKMIKNLLLKSVSSLYSSKNTTTSLYYVLAKGYKNFHELIDFSLLATKIGNSGDIFIKKSDNNKISFAQRLKELMIPKTKIQKNRESFLTASEMARIVDFGEYFKVAFDMDMIPTQHFSQRLESLKVDLAEVEEV